MSAAGLISMIINFVVIGFLSGVIGYVIDIINNQTIFYNLAYGTLNTINYLTLMFWFFPFVFLFFSVINYLIVSSNEQGGWA